MFKPVVTVTLMTLFFTGILVPKSVAEKRLIRLMRKQFMALVAFAVMTFSFQKVYAEKYEGTFDKQQLNRLEKMNEERAKEKNTQIVFYGKIVDLDGNPVTGANIKMNRSFVPSSVLLNDQEKIRITTDNNDALAKSIGIDNYMILFVKDANLGCV